MLHKFANHQIANQTEILILGTFHPNVDNGADFFYCRSRNYLWNLLPRTFGKEGLKRSTLQDKLDFITKYRIDFLDVIQELSNVPINQQFNYNDKFIDSLVHEWSDVIGTIDNLSQLKSVYFTRKTFTGIPNIENKIGEIRNHCVQKCIRFCLLETPSRFENKDKLDSWVRTIIKKEACL